MSISSPKLKNPAAKFIEFKGDRGAFCYYDKELEKQVEMNLPMRFIVLDQLNTIVGFNESEKSGIFSNEVHSLTDEVLSVRFFKGGTLAKGTYENIRDKVIANGGKFCKVVYALLKGEELELVAFKFSGAAFGAWLEFSKKVDLTSKGVQVCDEFVDGKKGSVKYKLPVFKPLVLPGEYIQKAIEMDLELQEYFQAYKSQQREAISQDVEVSEVKEVKETPKETPAEEVKFGDEDDLNNGEDLPF